ncbi:uncharacterized protein [Pyxicephalus adspersus]
MCGTVFKKVPLKASPSKKSRTVPGMTRRATQALVPTQLQLADENKQYLMPEMEADQDVLPRTPPVDEAASDSLATTLSTSSLGSGGLNSPAHRSVGVEVHKAEATEHEMYTQDRPESVKTGEEEDEDGSVLDPDQIETEISFVRILFLCPSPEQYLYPISNLLSLPKSGVPSGLDAGITATSVLIG